jgi:hypothetical protein
LCDAGNFQTDPGSTSCIPCSPGRFMNESGKFLCLARIFRQIRF